MRKYNWIVISLQPEDSPAILYWKKFAGIVLIIFMVQKINFGIGRFIIFNYKKYS